MSRLLIVAICCLLPTFSVAADDAAKPKSVSPNFELRDGDRVVFLGNTLIERAQKYGYWETMLTTRYPDRNITFRNLGWSGDTVWAESRGIFDPPAVGYKRMIEHVGRLKPTVIFVGYGNNEAFAGKAGLPAFIKQYNKLLDDLTAVSASGVRFVLLSPVKHEETTRPLPSPHKFNLQLREYARSINQIAAERGGRFVNISSRVIDLGNWKLGRGGATTNGIHLTEISYYKAGQVIDHDLLHPEEALPERSVEWNVSVSTSGKVIKSIGTRVTSVKTGEAGLSFKSTADRVVRLPEDVFPSGRFLTITGLPEGKYELRIDGQPAGFSGWGFTEYINFRPLVGDASDWAKALAWNSCPEQARAEKLRQTIIEKNRLYFYRWRPQNITYLFGFRKHEQGQNAKELAEFDKLIAAKEAEINKLKKPVPHTYEIIRVKAGAK